MRAITAVFPLVVAAFVNCISGADSPALVIGDYNVSSYLVRKYFDRFLADSKRQTGHPASISDREDWFRHFTVNQAIIAHLFAIGYASRPDVVEETKRMEEHILTDRDGPFYKSIIKAKLSISGSDISRSIEKLSKELDLTVVSFPSRDDARPDLGDSFEKLPPEMQMQRIAASRQNIEADFSEGWISWPFQPFSWASDAIMGAPIGRWITLDAPEGFCAFVVHAERYLPRIDAQSALAGLRPVIVRMTEDAYVRALRARELREAKLQLNCKVIAMFAERVLRTGTPMDILHRPTYSDIMDAPLCKFNFEGHRHLLTVAEFIDHFDRRYIRLLPTSIQGVRREIQSIVCEELDLVRAREAGVSREYVFEQDRFGFQGFQALASYEDHELAPSLKVGAESIHNYYSSHSSLYSHPSYARGQLLRFVDYRHAAEWIRSNTGDSGPAISGILDETRCEIPFQGCPTALEAFHNTIFGPLGKSVAGPAEVHGKFVVFRRTEIGPPVNSPEVDVASSVRDLLLRQALLAREDELALTLSGAVLPKWLVDVQVLIHSQ